MADEIYHGVSRERDLNPNSLFVDSRPKFVRWWDWISDAGRVSGFLSFAGFMLIGVAALFLTQPVPIKLAAVFFPIEIFAGLTLLVGFFAWKREKRAALPLRLPIQTNQLDPGDLDPFGQPDKARGINLVGHDRLTGSEIWVSDDEMRVHFLFFATTGGGKTEALLGFVANALSWGSGLMFVDGKGDNALWFKFVALARMLGRDDDIRLINFTKGGQEVSRASNTLNPFSTDSSAQIAEAIVTNMSSGASGNDMWKDRAIGLVYTLLPPIVRLRERGELIFDVSVLRSYLPLDRMWELYEAHKETAITTQDMEMTKSLESYFATLPGFKMDKGANQEAKTLEQHGYLTMQLTKQIADLADTYGHIFAAPLGELDYYDAVIQRRLVMAILPSLEKSSASAAALGKLVVGCLKNLMARTLGAEVEGSYGDAVESKVTKAKNPYPIIFDEAGYYCADGMAVMAAQARGLGFSMMYSSQDLPSLKRENEKEVGSIIGNCGLTLAGKIVDIAETAKLVIEKGAKAFVSRQGSFQGERDDLRNSDGANLHEQSRINERDLLSQKAGQVHLISADNIFRVSMFYPNPDVGKHDKDIYLQRLIRVRMPEGQMTPDEAEQELADLKAFLGLDPADRQNKFQDIRPARTVPLADVVQQLDRDVSTSPSGADRAIQLLVGSIAAAEQAKVTTQAAEFVDPLDVRERVRAEVGPSQPRSSATSDASDSAALESAARARVAQMLQASTEPRTETLREMLHRQWRGEAPLPLALNLDRGTLGDQPAEEKLLPLTLPALPGGALDEILAWVNRVALGLGIEPGDAEAASRMTESLITAPTFAPPPPPAGEVDRLIRDLHIWLASVEKTEKRKQEEMA